MARRRNDPFGLSDNPICVTHPGREAELFAEFKRRLAYIVQHYRMGKLIYGTVPALNQAIRALKHSGPERPAVRHKYKRLPPMLEVAISVNARRAAAERTGHEDVLVEGADITAAAAQVAKSVDPISHRPRDDNLVHSVEGLIALIQEFSGRPIIPRRNRNSDYEPHFAPGVSQLVPQVFKAVEPDVTTTQLVTIAESARRKWAGRRPTFSEYFPAYGLGPRPDGSLISPSGLMLIAFEPNIPTYFH